MRMIFISLSAQTVLPLVRVEDCFISWTRTIKNLKNNEQIFSGKKCFFIKSMHERFMYWFDWETIYFQNICRWRTSWVRFIWLTWWANWSKAHGFQVSLRVLLRDHTIFGLHTACTKWMKRAIRVPIVMRIWSYSLVSGEYNIIHTRYVDFM